MGLRWLSDLVGTALNYFRIGYTGPRLKNTSGVLEIRNSGDTADAAIKAYDRVHQLSFNQGTTSPATIFTPENGEIVNKVVQEVTTAATGGSPTTAVGVSGTTGAYQATTESNLKEVGVYEVEPMVSNAAAPVILTITPSAQTFVGKVTVFTTLPG